MACRYRNHPAKYDGNSTILNEYVMHAKKTALNVRRKMGCYSADENGSEKPDTAEGLQIPEEAPLTHCIYQRKVAEVTGLEPAASGVTGRLKVRNSINLPPPKDHTEPWGYARDNTGQ